MKLSLCLAVLVVLVCPWASAKEPFAPLTADGAARLAVEQNRRVRAAREQAESARQSLRGTGAQRLPRLTTSAAYTRINDSGASLAATGGGPGAGAGGAAGGAGSYGLYGGIGELTTATVSVVEPLADQVGLSHAVGIARLEATIAALDQTAAENAAAFGARKAFYTVLTHEKTVEAVEQTITELEGTLKLTHSLKEAGRVLQRDVNKADIAVEQARLDLLRAQNALRSANSALRDVLGLPLNARLAPAPTEAVEPFDMTLDECIAAATVQRPALRASELRDAAARRGVALARSAYVPSLGASVSYLWQDTDLGGSDDGIALGLNWSWDVWDWGQRRSAVRGAEAASRAARLGYEDERSRVALEVERLWLAVGLAARKIEVAKKGWDYAVENVRVSRQKYEVGALLVTDLLDDQTALNDARIAYYVAVYDHAIALADLRRAMGER
jgi:outer membrane protein